METKSMTKNERIGASIVALFDLKKARGYEDRYNTDWGTKTLEGLGASVKRIVDEA